MREAERRLREGDRGLLARVRAAPAAPAPRALPQARQPPADRAAAAPVLAYLLGDPWTTGPRLLASPAIKAEAERRRGPEILDAFLDLAVALRRFEIVSHLRERVESLGAERSLELEEKTRLGLRVYEFGESAEVLNNAVAATVLFLDLRGFTRTSEGQISERDLTRELYAVFDDFVPIVERFGGTVDKYLGDGMMVTWGTDRADPLDPLNALRTAILCQESLRRKREDGRTWFKMGVAIHHGRVYLARFIAGPGRAALDRDRPQREPGGAPLLGGEAARWRRTRTARRARAPAVDRAGGERRRRRDALQRGHRPQPRRGRRSSRRTSPSCAARTGPWSTRTRRSTGAS